MATRPNVLLITTDHWPAALLGCAGHPVIQTPTLDALAASGMRFTNAYSECPVCIPARRTLMTGVSPRTHGDRNFGETLPMPALPTLAATFSGAGYQAYAVGKLHVYPQRNRIGFDDVILDEEGRAQYGVTDDYELFLGDAGYAGQQFFHGMSNNRYVSRPWHLPERTHATNWATAALVRTIKRRDPTRPAFWYLSYRHPHPPLVPLAAYLDLYRGLPLDEPRCGAWAADPARLPLPLRAAREREAYLAAPEPTAAARRAFYALCTHVDHPAAAADRATARQRPRLGAQRRTGGGTRSGLPRRPQQGPVRPARRPLAAAPAHRPATDRVVHRHYRLSAPPA